MSHLPANYLSTLDSLKKRILQARQRAVISVNREMLLVYWEIGYLIMQMQEDQRWGAKVIDRLNIDLRKEFPDFKGLSVRNLKYMVTFARRFPYFGQRRDAQLENTENQQVMIGQQLAAQLPWGHLQVLLDKVKDGPQLIFYIQKCIDFGWARNILIEQIKSDLYGRQGAAITNFQDRLPAVHSDLAQQTLKNPYLFDFILSGDEVRELELEKGLVQHLKEFMLELGRGFAYVGRQKNLVVEGDDFFLDLLFYNYAMHCFVVFELKVGDFKPEYAGKLNFYVNAINQQLKGRKDNPTIGVLLCKTPNETVVRYSLQGIESPIGVAEYQLAAALPPQFKSEIPTVEELEAEIDKEYQELRSPAEKKWDDLKQKLTALEQPKLEVAVTYELLCEIFDRSMKPLFEKLLERLSIFREEFMSYEYYWSGTTRVRSLEELGLHWKNEEFVKAKSETTFNFRLLGLKALGTDTFDVSVELNYLWFNPYWYGVSITNRNHGQPIVRKLYTEQLLQNDLQLICSAVSDQVVDEIENRVNNLENSRKSIR